MHLLSFKDLYRLASDFQVSYWTGVVCGLLMLLLFLYPVRKYFFAYNGWGKMSQWFNAHVILGEFMPDGISEGFLELECGGGAHAQPVVFFWTMSNRDLPTRYRYYGGRENRGRGQPSSRNGGTTARQAPSTRPALALLRAGEGQSGKRLPAWLRGVA